ncbi:Putative ribonuclease H protein [Apostasia shenzhenica]|uniref:Ribonuclease H protein n=1 Tax=Apostasia shenzhenica TaxID=1088818 RepID=A0A2I0A354_9ASPA|nr:Putative ribonuclease H protein [Apostasia shenzhenica]
MSKAFDRVEWPFLRAIMLKLGFPNCWVERVMDCITSAQFKALINGKSTETITPQRGLRQGCPLSPYRFLLCAEGFSALLHSANKRGRLKGIACSRYAPKINHLLFADDSLIFGEANEATCSEIKETLRLYEMASGQAINFHKSSISFSPNVSTDLKLSINNWLEIGYDSPHEVYLGLPSFTIKNKRLIFNKMKEQVWKKLQSWKSKLFSFGGREILIKAVAQATSVFTMSVFKLPQRLIDELNATMMRFWWGGNNDKRCIHWANKCLLSKSKLHGGMGFRNLSAFNKALLAKQGWRIITHSNSLMARVLKAKYFHNCDFLMAQASPNSSYIWRSILWGRDLLKLGLRWRIGNGNSVRVFGDPWLPRPISFQAITSPNPNLAATRIVELLTEDGSWNWEKINSILWSIDYHLILEMPPCSTKFDDALIWHWDKKGSYSVKSGYVTTTQGESNVASSSNGGFNLWWKKLWSCKIPNKLKTHAWRAFHSALLTRSSLAKRGILSNSICPCCMEDIECETHALWLCVFAQESWRISSL